MQLHKIHYRIKMQSNDRRNVKDNSMFNETNLFFTQDTVWQLMYASDGDTATLDSLYRFGIELHNISNTMEMTASDTLQGYFIYFLPLCAFPWG